MRPEGFERELGPGGLEVRALPGAQRLTARVKGDDSAPGIAGYGSVFDTPATIGFYFQFDEEVAPGAWSKTIREGDIRSMFNHDSNWLLGRTKSGSLRLSEDDDGLLYDVDINPDDLNAMSVYRKVERRDVDGSSVFFRVIREEWTEPTEENGLERPKRRILEAELFETGPVVFPAFEETTAAARSAHLTRAVDKLGLSAPAQRARAAANLLASGSELEAEIRALLSQSPDLRTAVCACETSRAADQAPGSHGTPLSGHLPPDYYAARARGLAALTGLSLRKD